MTTKPIYILQLSTLTGKNMTPILFEDFADATEEKQFWEAKGFICWIENHVLNKKTKRKAA